MLAADVLKRVPDADTVASAVIAAEAVIILPLSTNELKGVWENALKPNIFKSLYSLFVILSIINIKCF
jgi:hypothetical protein